MDIVGFDYMWMRSGQKEPEDPDSETENMRDFPILVIKDTSSRNVAAYMVPQKGAHWYGIKAMMTE